jgi:hypothetical protein
VRSTCREERRAEEKAIRESMQAMPTYSASIQMM